MKRIKVTITAIDSLVITSSSGEGVFTPIADYISGTMLRGILAGEYIRKEKLGTEAHKDARFRKLFFGNISYTNSLPVLKGKAAVPVPFSLMVNKQGTELKNLLTEDAEAGYKAVRGMAVVDENKLYRISVDKSINFHMSRGNNEKNRIAGRSEDGQVFNYESIAPGQIFIGEIIGADDDLKDLLDAMPQREFFGRVGRSRFTQYGTVKLQLGEVEELDMVVVPEGKQVYVHAISPIIPMPGQAGSAQKILKDMFESIIPGVEVDKAFASMVSIDNFVNIWGMKRPRVQALAGGTVFILTKDQWTAEDIKHLEDALYMGIGQRTQEGFGQLRLWKIASLAMGSPQEGDGVSAVGGQIEPGLAREVAVKVVEKYILEQLKQFAHDDAYKMKYDIKPHFFARMLQELGDINSAGDKRVQLSKQVNRIMEEKDKSPYYKTMKQLSVNGATFEDLLGDTAATMPYIKAWHEALTRRKLGTLLEALDMKLSDKEISNGKYFYTYWYWLLRRCRKLSASKKEA